MLVKVEVIVKCDAEVFKGVNNLNRVMVDGYGAQGLRGTDEFFGFDDVEVEVVILAPLFLIFTFSL